MGGRRLKSHESAERPNESQLVGIDREVQNICMYMYVCMYVCIYIEVRVMDSLSLCQREKITKRARVSSDIASETKNKRAIETKRRSLCEDNKKA